MGKLNITQSMLKSPSHIVTATDLVFKRRLSFEYDNAVLLLDLALNQKEGDVVAICVPSSSNSILFEDTRNKINFSITIDDNNNVVYKAIQFKSDAWYNLFDFVVNIENIKNNVVGPFYDMYIELLDKLKDRIIKIRKGEEQ